MTPSAAPTPQPATPSRWARMRAFGAFLVAPSPARHPWAQERRDAQAPTASRKQRGNMAVLALVVAAVIVVGVVLASKPDRSTAAIAACEQFVQNGLTSPGSAKFHEPSSYSGSGNGPWLVNASVDSQNGFGALVRTLYTCTVTRDPAGDWHLEALTTA